MKSMADAAVRLLRDECGRKQFGQAAFDYVFEHHRMEAAVDRFEEVYERAVAEATGGR